MTTPTTLTAVDHTRPWSLNAERSDHWRRHREKTREARERWAWLWMAAGAKQLHLDVVEVIAQPSYKARPQDTGACYGSVKAAIDALVDVGCIPGDTGKHVLAITMLAPLAGVDGLTISALSCAPPTPLDDHR